MAAAPVLADTVQLSNGNSMEGLIVREDRSELELDIGYGTVVLRKAEVVRVVRSSAKEKGALRERQRDAGFASGRGVPPSCREVFERFESLRSLREKALDARARLEGAAERAAALESQIASSKKSYPELARRLQGTPVRDPSYDKAVHQLNALSAGIDADRAQVDELRGEAGETRAEVNAYLVALDDFRGLMASDPGLSGTRPAAPDEALFHDWLRRSVAEMEKDSVTESVGTASRGSHVVVEVLVNGRAKAVLMVDTGASVVVLTRRAADLMGIGPADERGAMDMTVADGRKVQARAVVLGSVEVGKMRAQRVEAAVLPDFEPGLDGLLGMSFLKRFDVRVDSVAGRLVLRDLR